MGSGLGSSSGGLGLGSSNSNSGSSSAFGSSSNSTSTQSTATTSGSSSSATSTSTNSSPSGLNKGPVTLVTFTHGGWANPAGIQRPALQRVSYVIENGTLRRDKVKSVTLRYMDVSFNWRDQWPPTALVGDPTANLRLRPIAVEVTLELEDWGTIVRVIEIPA